jgi:2-polyprenyl-3-methyl-5-hydroxy-6-metoxy-1,4-benzoquinol methylase
VSEHRSGAEERSSHVAARTSYRIDDDADQVRQERERLLVLARLLDPSTEATLRSVGITDGWHCCEVGAGAGTVATWMAKQVGATGRVVSVDVDTRFHIPATGCLEVRDADVTREAIGDREFDLVHARGVLQHIAQREAVLDMMIAATKPGGWIVVTDVDWVQFDEQPVPEPFATLSKTLRALSVQQHGYDGTWGRKLVGAFQRRSLVEVDAAGAVWTMHGGTDSAEWYVAALARALDVLPTEVLPPGFAPWDAIAQARQPDFAILSPISVTAKGRKPALA